MAVAYLVLRDIAVALEHRGGLGGIVESMMGLEPSVAEGVRVVATVAIEQWHDARCRVRLNGELVAGDLLLGDAINTAWKQVVLALVPALPKPSIVLHTASLARDGVATVVLGESGRGKSSLTAWLMKQGHRHLSDDVAILLPDGRLSAIYGPLYIRRDVWPLVEKLDLPGQHLDLDGGGRLIQPQAKADTPSGPLPCRLILMPVFNRKVPPAIELISPARAAMALMAQNYGAIETADHGLALALAAAGRATTLRLTYGSFEQIDGVLQPLLNRVLASDTGDLDRQVAGVNRELAARASAIAAAAQTAAPSEPPAPTAKPLLAPTPRRNFKPKLTIGMATYDDYDGVYFSVQALRLYHPDVMAETEIIVIDNHPEGEAAPLLKKLDTEAPNFRYIPYTEKGGTAASREHLFAEAAGDFVMCMDCHVLLAPNALNRLMAYIYANPQSSDLLQGPLLYDDHKSISTHWEPRWRAGMFGTWATDERANDIDAEPFEIPLLGLGVFASRRDAWLHFNPLFRGFGGEEGYIHEKYRQAGHKALCLPFLRWMHRFGRIGGPPYVNIWEDRIHNYYIGHRELGWSTAEMEAHFAEHLGKDAFERMRNAIGLAPAKVVETA